MLGSDFVKAQLCIQCWRDAKDDGINGMLGCAFTLRNRVRKGWFNGDWLSLLSHHRDYAAVNVPPEFELPDTRNYTFTLLLQQIDDIFSGRRDDDITISTQSLYTGQAGNPVLKFEGQGQKPVALYYGRLGDPNLRDWFRETISTDHENHVQVASVGSLTFFS